MMDSTEMRHDPESTGFMDFNRILLLLEGV